MPRIEYDVNGIHYPSQAALERDVKAHIKAAPRDRVFHDDFLKAIVNTLHDEVIETGEHSSGDFELLTWNEQSFRGMRTAVDYRGGELMTSFFERCRRWESVTVYPWRRASNRQQVIEALRAKMSPFIPKPTTRNHCAIGGCDARWHDLQYHHEKPTFAEMVEQAMLLISEQEIATRFGYNKFTPGTNSVADFIPAYHPAIIYLIKAHQTSIWKWLCPLHHNGVGR